MSDVICVFINGRKYYLVNDRYIRTDCVCYACNNCKWFLSCIERDINSVLFVNDCNFLVYHLDCLGHCKGCFLRNDD